MIRNDTDKIYQKIQPFFKKLKVKGLYEEFDCAEWTKKNTEAWRYAKKYLAKNERELLKLMVYAEMLLGS